jgi:hypothetical protein
VLHSCIEGERVGDDGGEVDGVDRHHDDCPGGVPAPPGERGREAPSFFFLLGLPHRWDKDPPSGPWPPRPPRGGSPSILDISLFSSLFHVSVFWLNTVF